MSHDANSHRTQCDQCFTHTKVAAALIGKRIKCRSCGHVFIVDPPPPELKKFKDSPIVPQPKPLPTPANDGTAPQQTTAASVPDLRITHRPGQYTPERRKKLPNYALAENITRHIATGASVALFFSIGSSFALLQDDKGTRRNNFVFCISLRSSLLCGAMTAILHRRGAKSAEVVGANTRTHLSSSPYSTRQDWCGWALTCAAGKRNLEWTLLPRLRPLGPLNVIRRFLMLRTQLEASCHPRFSARSASSRSW